MKIKRLGWLSTLLAYEQSLLCIHRGLSHVAYACEPCFPRITTARLDKTPGLLTLCPEFEFSQSFPCLRTPNL
jgi:hypothetical protein